MNFLQSKLGLPIAVVLIVLAVGVLVYNLRKGSTHSDGAGNAFFVDEETGEESVASAKEIPPLPGNDGRPTRVLAIKYTLDGKTPQIRYLLKYTDEAQEKMRALNSDPSIDPSVRMSTMAEITEKGILIRSPEQGSKWLPGSSDEARTLQTIPTGPDGKQGTVITPN